MNIILSLFFSRFYISILLQNIIIAVFLFYPDFVILQSIPPLARCMDSCCLQFSYAVSKC